MSWYYPPNVFSDRQSSTSQSNDALVRNGDRLQSEQGSQNDFNDEDLLGTVAPPRDRTHNFDSPQRESESGYQEESNVSSKHFKPAQDRYQERPQKLSIMKNLDTRNPTIVGQGMSIKGAAANMASSNHSSTGSKRARSPSPDPIDSYENRRWTPKALGMTNSRHYPKTHHRTSNNIRPQREDSTIDEIQRVTQELSEAQERHRSSQLQLQTQLDDAHISENSCRQEVTELRDTLFKIITGISSLSALLPHNLTASVETGTESSLIHQLKDETLEKHEGRRSITQRYCNTAIIIFDSHRARCTSYLSTQEDSIAVECDRLRQKKEALQKKCVHLRESLKKEHMAREEHINEIALLRSKPRSPTSSISIDPFDQTLDQVSEADIKSNGNPSLDSVNGAIDNLVANILEQGDATATATNSTRDAPHPWAQSDDALLSTLAQPNLSHDAQGFVLDAHLHDLIIKHLHEYEVIHAPVTPGVNSPALNTIFRKIQDVEPWGVSQRWRALTTSNFYRIIPQHFWDKKCHSLAEKISKHLEIAYNHPHGHFSAITNQILTELIEIHRQTMELSVIIRRDVLSVALSLTICEGNLFNTAGMDSPWPEMGDATGDSILGQYALGLTKTSDTQVIKHILKPKAITVALLRQIEKGV